MLGPSTKRKFDTTMTKYGHTVYLRRRKDDVGEGPYMQVEDGRYEPSAEAWTSFRVLRKSPLNSGNSKFMSIEDAGYLTEADAIFYMTREAAPKSSDLIYEKTPHERHAREKYILKRAIPEYIGNTVVYFICLADRIDPVV